MTDSIAQILVILTYKLVWFLGQAALFFLLWNFAVAPYLSVAKIGVVQSVAIYALLRLVVDPPKLTVEIN